MRLASLLFLSCCLLSGSAYGQAEANPWERALLGLVNRTRAQYGLRPLVWDSGLARAARAHAERLMRTRGELEHQYPGEPDLVLRASRQGARFTGIGENLARDARTAAELNAAWMSTPIHRGNLLSLRWNSIGIGVLESQGLLYAVEDFSDSGPELTYAEIEMGVGDALHRAGVPKTDGSHRARTVCQAGQDPGDLALFVVWDGPTPLQLPPALLQRLAETSFHSAEVGACAGKPTQPGFTSTRVAVLLQ